jgi:hypothetical protein
MNGKQTTSWPTNLRRPEAARYLGEVHNIPVTANTLANWFSLGADGPPAFKAGRTPLYPKAALDQWAKARLGTLRTRSPGRGREKGVRR